MKRQLTYTITITITVLFMLCLLPLAAQTGTHTEYHHTYYDDHNGMSHWHSTKILQDKHGFMWFASWNGLNRFDGYNFAVFKSKPGDGNNLLSDRIRDMILGDDGHLYCVNYDVVWRFNLDTYRFEPVTESQQEYYLAIINRADDMMSPPRDLTFGDYTVESVRQQFTDSQNNIWLMRRYGIDKFSPANSPAHWLESVPRLTVRAFFRDSKGRYWVGIRDHHQVLLLDSSANFMGYLTADGRLSSSPVTFAAPYSFYQQRNGTIWMGTKPDGLFRINERADGTFQIKHFPKGTPSQIKAGTAVSSSDIYDIHEDSKGRLWLATLNGGVNIMDNISSDAPYFHNCENDLRHFPMDNQLVRRIMSVGDSVIFITTTEGLIVAHNIDKAPQSITFQTHQRDPLRKESLSCNATMDLLLDRKGRVLISTESGGVNLLLTKDFSAKQFDFEHYTTDDGMGSDVALTMCEAGEDILVQCNNQVSRINLDTETIENYNDMFFSEQLRFSDARPLKLADGRWFLTMEDGILVVPETVFHQRPYVPRLVLTQLTVPGKPSDYTIENRDTIVLESPDRDVTISYAALDFYSNSGIKYITRITEKSGWWTSDKDSVEWSSPQDNHTTSLYNLSPGTYVFEIRSTNAAGIWVDNVRKVTIIVKPAFWESTTAYVIYLLLLIMIVAGVTYTVTYIRNLRRQREENLQAYLEVLQKSKTVSAVSAGSNVLSGQPVVSGNPDDGANHDGDDSPADVIQSAVATDVSDGPHMVASPIIKREDDAFMRRLIDFVDKNLGDSSVGVEEMANATATSRSSLNRKMKYLLGVTPADFLREARLKRAQQLLVNTSQGINEIAYVCGFSDPKYFSKCFKNSVGMTPSEYRQQTS